ncbi:hypothetical protein [Leclercia adecarboxylata]|uniref:hypothetical protein n=1 Tax=Leclercia adecarboxylata TaxID=83655 RepID=UPI00254EDD7F|nr:hypothetical protein [Leclercia adecarboxylata]
MINNYHPLPAIGDIIWCRFSQHVDLGHPGPKARPGLILNVFPDLHAVLIVYGTSRTDHVYQGEFVIDDQLDTAGLSWPTKFDLNRLQKLPFNTEWFAVAPGVEINTPLPKMGVIPPVFIPVMRAAWAKRG